MAEKYGMKVKELMVREMSENFTGGEGFIFSTFENIKATEIDVFRKKMRRAGSKYFVIKKRIARRALEDAGLDGLTGVLTEKQNIGAGVIAEDPVMIAKLMAEFAKTSKNFKIAGGVIDGKVIQADRVKELADLPGREQLLAMVLSMMNAPITGFVGVLSGVIKKVVYALNAIKEKKEKEG